jgi:F-type H+-transporting ATPase subunit delta
MADIRVASRYVKSLLGLAVEQGVVEEVNKDMKLFASVCEANRAFANMLRSPIIKHDKKRDVLHAIFNGKVQVLTLSIMDILTRKNREPLLPSIATEFAVAYTEYKGIEKATVTTTFPIDAKLKADVEAIVKKLSTRKQVELVEKVDKDLIGGFILNVGDRQIDASVKSKLKSLKVKFAENPYVREI